MLVSTVFQHKWLAKYEMHFAQRSLSFSRREHKDSNLFSLQNFGFIRLLYRLTVVILTIRISTIYISFLIAY